MLPLLLRLPRPQKRLFDCSSLQKHAKSRSRHSAGTDAFGGVGVTAALGVKYDVSKLASDGDETISDSLYSLYS